MVSPMCDEWKCLRMLKNLMGGMRVPTTQRYKCGLTAEWPHHLHPMYLYKAGHIPCNLIVQYPLGVPGCIVYGDHYRTQDTLLQIAILQLYPHRPFSDRSAPAHSAKWTIYYSCVFSENGDHWLHRKNVHLMRCAGRGRGDDTGCVTSQGVSRK